MLVKKLVWILKNSVSCTFAIVIIVIDYFMYSRCNIKKSYLCVSVNGAFVVPRGFLLLETEVCNVEGRGISDRLRS